MSEFIKARLLVFSNTLAGWTATNPFIAQGEIVAEVGGAVTKLKAGDGVNLYLDLPYISGGGSGSALQDVLNDGNNASTATGGIAEIILVDGDWNNVIGPRNIQLSEDTGAILSMQGSFVGIEDASGIYSTMSHDGIEAGGISGGGSVVDKTLYKHNYIFRLYTDSGSGANSTRILHMIGNVPTGTELFDYFMPDEGNAGDIPGSTVVLHKTKDAIEVNDGGGSKSDIYTDSVSVSGSVGDSCHHNSNGFFVNSISGGINQQTGYEIDSISLAYSATGVAATRTLHMLPAPPTGTSVHDWYMPDFSSGSIPADTVMLARTNSTLELVGADVSFRVDQSALPARVELFDPASGRPIAGFHADDADTGYVIIKSPLVGSGKETRIKSCIVTDDRTLTSLDASGSIPSITVSGDLIGRTATTTSATITPDIDGTFLIGGYVNTTSAGLGTVQSQIAFQDVHGTNQTFVLNISNNTGVIGNTISGVASFYSFVTVSIRAKAGHPISIIHTLTGAVTFDCGGSITKTS